MLRNYMSYYDASQRAIETNDMTFAKVSCMTSVKHRRDERYADPRCYRRRHVQALADEV